MPFGNPNCIPSRFAIDEPQLAFCVNFYVTAPKPALASPPTKSRHPDRWLVQQPSNELPRRLEQAALLCSWRGSTPPWRSMRQGSLGHNRPAALKACGRLIAPNRDGTPAGNASGALWRKPQSTTGLEPHRQAKNFLPSFYPTPLVDHKSNCYHWLCERKCAAF